MLLTNMWVLWHKVSEDCISGKALGSHRDPQGSHLFCKVHRAEIIHNCILGNDGVMAGLDGFNLFDLRKTKFYFFPSVSECRS